MTILKTCPHIETGTAISTTGDSFTHLNSLNPEGKHDCEVCRKLLAFDGLLEACKGQVLANGHTLQCICSQGKDREMGRKPQCSCEALRAAIAKAEPAP